MSIITSSLRHTLLAAALLLPIITVAQDDEALEGYTNLFVRIAATPEGAGTVSALPPTGGLATYQPTLDFKETLPVASALMAIYFNVNVRVAEGYSFVGWYVDTNNNGVFDLTEDEYITNLPSTLIFLPVADDWTIYETEPEARASAGPATPQYNIFAYFSSGAIAMTDYHQENMGTVEIDKPDNTRGDIVTVTATPAEGYSFAYWKSTYNSTILDPNHSVITTDNPYTFQVNGGERLYAYFTDNNAPEAIEFPEEGGWKIAPFDRDWVLHEQDRALIYKFNFSDLILIDNEQLVFNTDEDDAKYDVVSKIADYGFSSPTLIYGHGKVYFSFRESHGYDRADNILKWSGKNGITITDNNNAFLYHVYAFDESVEAFVQIGTTDNFADPQAQTTVRVPAQTAYFALSAYDIANVFPQLGVNIPEVIGLPHPNIDRNVFDLSTLSKVNTLSQEAVPTVVYDLSGRRVTTPHHGLYIIGGKKYIVK